MRQERIKRAKSLLQQILDKALEDDGRLKNSLKKSKYSATIGESWMVFHLSLLKKTLDEID